jgi:hypothetical protein
MIHVFFVFIISYPGCDDSLAYGHTHIFKLGTLRPTRKLTLTVFCLVVNEIADRDN